MKVYSRHYCRRRHRSYRTAAACIWKRAAWIAGDGPYASVSYCGVLTVALYPTADEALAAKRFIDRLACGHRCRRESGHEVVHLLDPSQMDATSATAAPDPNGATA
jgi:hypothetical protein